MTKKIFKSLGFWILISMILGAVVGIAMGEQASMFRPVGEIFIQLLKMSIVPLVTCSIIAGAGSLGKSSGAGKLGVSTFALYFGTTIIAIIIGLIFGEVFKPGAGVDISAFKDMFSDQLAQDAVAQSSGFFDTIKGMIPLNPIQAMVEGNITQIIFFCLFLGFGISKMEDKKRTSLLNLFNNLTEALTFIIMKVMYLAPIGIFALIADATGTLGYSIFINVSNLFVLDILASLVHMIIVYGLLVKVFSKVKVTKFFKNMLKPQMFALSTSSSMAVLPINMEVCEKEFEVSKETTSFVLPLGATINMDGGAIYYALVACFFAQLYGIDLGVGQYIAIIFTATIGSIGQAGIPGPTFLVVAVLMAANIPVEALPILFAVDRIFDMVRTALNITGDAACAVCVDGFVNTGEGFEIDSSSVQLD